MDSKFSWGVCSVPSTSPVVQSCAMAFGAPCRAWLELVMFEYIETTLVSTDYSL